MKQITLKAEYPGILKLGDVELPCFVLNNKKRVLVQREIVNLLTGNRKGGLPRYINSKNIKEFMPKKFVDEAYKESIVPFIPTSGGLIAHAFEAEDVIDICTAYLKAREKSRENNATFKLTADQEAIAAQAEIFIRACAKVGIVALIDEATGYQNVRDADELQIKIKAYIAADLREWMKIFPREFFEQLYRLEGRIAPIPPKLYPLRFGRYVMNYVYDTMDIDIANWLRKHNPKPGGEKHHHQWFSEFGYEKFARHLMSVLGIMKASTSMENFRENLNRAFTHEKEQRRKLTPLKKAVKTPYNQEEMTFI